MTPTFRTSHPASAADPSKPHLILVGLPGSGKTSVGQGVAERTGRTFLDLDQEIERREARSIGQIFAEKGELYFRKKERELTEELTVVGNMVIAPSEAGWPTPTSWRWFDPLASSYTLKCIPRRRSSA